MVWHDLTEHGLQAIEDGRNIIQNVNVAVWLSCVGRAAFNIVREKRRVSEAGRGSLCQTVRVTAANDSASCAP